MIFIYSQILCSSMFQKTKDNSKPAWVVNLHQICCWPQKSKCPVGYQQSTWPSPLAALAGLSVVALPYWSWAYPTASERLGRALFSPVALWRPWTFQSLGWTKGHGRSDWPSTFHRFGSSNCMLIVLEPSRTQAHFKSSLLIVCLTHTLFWFMVATCVLIKTKWSSTNICVAMLEHVFDARELNPVHFWVLVGRENCHAIGVNSSFSEMFQVSWTNCTHPCCLSTSDRAV